MNNLKNNQNITAVTISEYYIQQPTFRLKKPRKIKKHVVKYLHVIDDSGNYIKTQEVYHLSWQRKLRYNNIDIYSDDSFKSLRKSFERKDSFYKGADVEIVSYKERQYSVRKKSTVERVPIYNKIILDLPEIHYTYDEDDKEYFRMRSCHFDNTVFPCEVSWTQERFRNSHYLCNIDTSQAEDIDPDNLDKIVLAKFDENSLYVYLNQAKMKTRLKKAILEINYAKSKSNYELKKNGDLICIPLKNKALGKFISLLFGYSMYLFYINTSHGWKYEDLNYELLWNLAMVVLQTAKPFDDKADWIEGVTVNRVKYLLSRKLFNISRGVDAYLIKNVCFFSENIHEKNLFMSNSSSSDKLNFKMNNLSRKKQAILEKNKLAQENKLKKKQAILERNKQIKEMYSKGSSVFLISNLFHISTKRIYSILKSLN